MSRRQSATLADPEVLAERRAALDAPHIAALERYRDALGARPLPAPHFDPFDGGSDARLLILLETPGSSRALTRFVSRDNPTGTAANLRRALSAAGVARADTVIWNTVPWVLRGADERTQAPRASDIAAALAVLPGLFDRLAHLHAVVLAGRIAGLAAPVIQAGRPDLAIARIAYPSPTYVNTRPDIFPGIVQGLANAAVLLRDPSQVKANGTS